MQNIKKLIAMLILIPVILMIVVFVLDNSEPLTIQLFGLSGPTLSAGGWMMLSFVVGGALGLLTGSAIIIQLRTRLKLQNKSLKRGS